MIANRPVIGVTLDLNDVWDRTEDFRAYCRAWTRLGVNHALLLSGSIHRAALMLPVVREEGVRVTVGGQEEIQPFLGGAGPETQEEADRVVAPVAAILAQHLDVVEAVYVDDEPEAVRILRLLLVADAYRRLLPGVPLTAALPGVNRGDLIQQAVGFDVLTIPVYPCEAGAPEGEFALGHEYVRAIQAGAGEPKDGPHAPLWIIGQGHRSDGLGLRYPTPAELRQQYEEAWRMGAERFYVFAWDSQAIRDPQTHEITGYVYHGLNEAPELQQALAEMDGWSGVPSLAIDDYGQSVEDWWAADPFNPEGHDYRPIVRVGTTHVDVNAVHGGSIQAAVDAASPDTTLWLGGGSYGENVNVVGKRDLAFVAKDGAAPLVTGQWRVIPTWDANLYHGSPAGTQWNSWTDMVKRNRITPGQGGSPQARAHDFLPGGPLESRGFLWRGLVFDRQGQRTSSLNVSTIADVLIEDCTFTGMIVPTSPSSHPGNVSGNAYLNSFTFRRVHFAGRGGYGSGDGDRPRHAVYLDGVHGFRAIDCTTPLERVYANNVYLLLCNDDYTLDRDRDGVIGVHEQRMAQYAMIYGGEYGTNYHVAAIVGRACALLRVTIPDGGNLLYGLVNLGDKANQATVFKPSPNVEQTSMQTVSGGPGYPIDMGGNYQGGTFAPIQYQYHGSVVAHNDVASAAELVTYESTATISGKIPPDLGASIIEGNILRVTQPVWYHRRFISTGPGGANTFTPPTVENNATSGEVAPAAPWSPEPYAYLEPASAPPPPPPADCAEHEAQIAVLEAQVDSLVAERDALAGDLSAALNQVTVLTGERDALAAWRDDVRGNVAALRGLLEEATS